MSNINRLKLLINDMEADYISASDIGITLNRVVDDMQHIDKRFGDFSYSFNLPATKNNNKIFNYANSNGRTHFFDGLQGLECRLYNQDTLLLEGTLLLQGFAKGAYKVVLFSKLKSFNDTIKNKSLRDLDFGTISGFTFEEYIVNHINSEYTNSDETFWQFPFIWYGTTYTPYPSYSGQTDDNGNDFNYQLADQLYYYTINQFDGNEPNRFYHHQFPPAFYIVSIMKQIFKDAGWRLSGSFFQDENIKKIVMLYAGDNDIYDQATGTVSGLTENLVISKLLPDLKQSEFISGIINMFNLYLKVNTTQKVIRFETYKTYFEDVFNPYDITDKIDSNSVDVSSINKEIGLQFENPLNSNVFGDNMAYIGTSLYWEKISNTNFYDVFNASGNTMIKLPFSAPTVKRQKIVNYKDINGSTNTSNTFNMVVPLMSKQTSTDDNNTQFNKDTGHTYVFNTEDTIKYNGKPMLMYYYGTSTGNDKDNYYLNMYYDTTKHNMKIGFCSPFQISNLGKEEAYLTGATETDNEKTIVADYLYFTKKVIGNNYTDYSLTFEKNSNLQKTLYTEFYELKNKRYKNNEIVIADMFMNDYDWKEMQLERPLKYNGEIYHLLVLNYSPLKRTAKITMIKH